MTTIRKICLLGDPYVGKQEVKRRFLGQKPYNQTHIVIGADFDFFELDIVGNRVALQIWDVAGQPSFREVRKTYYSGSQGIMLVFDLTKPASFESIKTNWLPEIAENLDYGPVSLMIVGTRLHLRDSQNLSHIYRDQGRRLLGYIQENYNYLPGLFADINYIEVSATTGKNIQRGFHTLFTDIIAITALHRLKPKYQYPPALKSTVQRIMQLVKGGNKSNNTNNKCFCCKSPVNKLLCQPCYQILKRKYNGIPTSYIIHENSLLPEHIERHIVG